MLHNSPHTSLDVLHTPCDMRNEAFQHMAVHSCLVQMYTGLLLFMGRQRLQQKATMLRRSSLLI